MAKLWTRGFIMICLINFLMFLSFNMITPTLPVYLQELGVNKTIIGIVTATLSFGSILTRPIAGTTVDRFGRKSVFLITTLLLVLLVFSYSIFTSVLFIFLLRMLHGFDWGFSSTAASTIAADTIPRATFGKGMGYFGISTGLSLAIAPAFALGIYNATNYETMIYTSTGILVLTMVLALFFPYSTENVRKKEEKSQGFSFEPCAIIPAVAMACVTLTMSAITSFVSLYALSLGIANVGMFFTIYAIGLVISRPILGNLVDKFSTITIAIPSYILIFIALVLIAMAKDLTPLLVAGFLYGFGYGGAQTSMQTMAVMGASHDHYGAATGTFFIGFDVGICIGSILAGFLAAAIGYAYMYLSLTIFIVIGIGLLIYQKHKLAKQPA